MDLQGKIAVVTGANKGIGAECVLQLLEKGAVVHGFCRSGCSVEHENFTCHTVDVRHEDQVAAAMQQILEKHGQVDILINNAGLGYFSNCEDLSLEQWHTLFDTNVNGLFYCTRLVLPGMKAQGRGHIINIASTAGLEGYPGVTAYCATKFAVRGFSDALYKEVRDHGVKVTCVYPGSVKTDFFRHHTSIKPHDNMLMPWDVAAQIVYTLETPDHFHTVNLEVRPLKPKG
ncbi:MAG: SDR family oxidoreductase [Bacteroidetes bacterium]|nr:SDR family oxidoreductase [Bacteroidota bacterium]